MVECVDWVVVFGCVDVVLFVDLEFDCCFGFDVFVGVFFGYYVLGF